ncbi:DUF1492 domain-containing protein [Eubacterium sp. An3]|uniref:DUF1492 domain-containing protein n=1 Tax=Eubacterium sp. An3 TaxID=1965628 RepID=UPI000B38A464|nr:DUF1492 domain-containing protein [Eubacterium sp. An3]OUO29690.1 hypothetical protein B5F87_04080 [Eubacterium sp. An3]
MEHKKQAKETDTIKQRLQNYAALQRRLDNKIERLVYLESITGSPSSPNLSGMPGSSGDGCSKTERQIVQKEELKSEIKDMTRRECEERKELERLVKGMQDPDEQTVIEMRYFDNAKWRPICDALYSSNPDYIDKVDKYMKRIFKIHGSALQTLTRIQKQMEA